MLCSFTKHARLSAAPAMPENCRIFCFCHGFYYNISASGEALFYCRISIFQILISVFEKWCGSFQQEPLLCGLFMFTYTVLLKGFVHCKIFIFYCFLCKTPTAKWLMYQALHAFLKKCLTIVFSVDIMCLTVRTNKTFEEE